MGTTIHRAMRVVVGDGNMVLDIILPYSRCKDDDLLSTLALPQRMCGAVVRGRNEDLVFRSKRSVVEMSRKMWFQQFQRGL